MLVRCDRRWITWYHLRASRLRCSGTFPGLLTHYQLYRRLTNQYVVNSWCNNTYARIFYWGLLQLNQQCARLARTSSLEVFWSGQVFVFFRSVVQVLLPCGLGFVMITGWAVHHGSLLLRLREDDVLKSELDHWLQYYMPDLSIVTTFMKNCSKYHQLMRGKFVIMTPQISLRWEPVITLNDNVASTKQDSVGNDIRGCQRSSRVIWSISVTQYDWQKVYKDLTCIWETVCQCVGNIQLLL